MASSCKKRTWPCKKKKKRKLDVSVPRRPLLSPLFFSLKQTRVTFDSAYRRPVPNRDEGIGHKGADPPYLCPAPPAPAIKPLSNRRLTRAVARRHHTGPWFLWFRWYWKDNREKKLKTRSIYVTFISTQMYFSVIILQIIFTVFYLSLTWFYLNWHSCIYLTERTVYVYIYGSDALTIDD